MFGCGNVGLFAVMGANLLPLDHIIAIDIFDGRLEITRELGATHTLNSAGVHIVEAVREMTDGRGVDYALDTTGNPKVERLITHYRLEELETAAAEMRAGTVIKPVIRFEILRDQQKATARSEQRESGI